MNEREVIEKYKLGLLLANGDELVDWYRDLDMNCDSRIKVEMLLAVRQELIRRGLGYIVKPPTPTE